MKLGKLPATYDKRDLRFSDYKTTLPACPQRFGYDSVVGADSWDMLGNDQYGDCVWAGAGHEHMVLTATESTARPSPSMVRFTDAGILGAYSQCTGFSPNNPNSDQGTNVRDAMAFRAKTGIKDAGNTVHKIGAYLSLEPGNLQEVFEALYLFQVVGIGIEFPTSAMDQFNAGKPWSVVSGSRIEGGHYVPVLSRQYSSTVKVVTWGQLQTVTEGFYQKYCDEAWCFVAPDLLNSAGLSARGFNVAQLQADLAAL